MTSSTDVSERTQGREVPIEVQLVYGELRGRLDGDLLAMAYDPRGDLLSVEEGGTLRRWNPRAGIQLESFPLSEVEPCWCFSPAGDLLASGGTTLTIWHAPTAEPIHRLEEPSWTRAIAFSPDGQYFASGHEDRTVRLWHVQTGTLLHTLSAHQNEVCALAFSHDGKRLASAGEDRLVVIWNVEDATVDQRLLGHTDHIDALAWNGSSTRLASAAWDTSVRIWDPERGELLAMLNGQGDCVHVVRFLPGDGVLICGDSESTVRVWDYNRLEVLAEFSGHRGPVRQLALSRNMMQLASGGGDRSIRFWDLLTHQPQFADQGPRTEVRVVLPSERGELALVHTEGRLTRWQEATARSLPVEESLRDVVTVSQGRHGVWATGHGDGSISLRFSLDRAPERTWQAHEAAARLLAFSADGGRLLSSAGIDGLVKVWDASTGQLSLLVPDATNKWSVEAIAPHPSQLAFAVAGIDLFSIGNSDGIIAVWDLATCQRRLAISSGATQLAFSRDGLWLASISVDESIVLWNALTGKLARELTSPEMAFHSIAFDPTGRYLAGGNEIGGVRVWSVGNWRPVASFDLETPITAIAFTPSGDAILSGNGNSTAYRVELRSLSGD